MEFAQAYYRLAKKYHPDKNKSKDGAEIFKKVFIIPTMPG